MTVRGLSHHIGYIFQVIRPRSRALAARVAKIARTWANKRMGYRIAWHLGGARKWFGPRARREAWAFGRDAFRPGGPRGYKSMFCSQFVVAAYQAAVVHTQLQRNPRLRPERIRMPYALSLHASNSSPLAFHGRFGVAIEAKKTGDWSKVGLALITGKASPAKKSPSLLGKAKASVKGAAAKVKQQAKKLWRRVKSWRRW